MKLYAQYPPIEEMDASLSTLVSCKYVLSYSNNLSNPESTNYNTCCLYRLLKCLEASLTNSVNPEEQSILGPHCLLLNTQCQKLSTTRTFFFSDALIITQVYCSKKDKGQTIIYELILPI